MNLTARDYDELVGVIYDFLEAKEYIEDDESTFTKIEENLSLLMDELS